MNITNHLSFLVLCREYCAVQDYNLWIQKYWSLHLSNLEICVLYILWKYVDNYGQLLTEISHTFYQCLTGKTSVWTSTHTTSRHDIILEWFTITSELTMFIPLRIYFRNHSETILNDSELVLKWLRFAWFSNYFWIALRIDSEFVPLWSILNT
jgi:hypothetical protein